MRRISAALAAALLAGMGGAALASPGGGGGMGSMPSMSAPAYDPTADYAHGAAALKDGQYRDAVHSLRRVTDAVPSSLDAWRLLGEAAVGDNDWKSARRAYEHAVKLAPDDVAAHAGLGLALARLKDPKAAGELDWLKSRGQACGACADASALKAGADQVESAIGAAQTPATKPLAAQDRPRADRPKPAETDQPMIFAGAAAGDVAYSTAVSLINQHRYDEALASLRYAEAVFGPHPDILTYEGYAWRKKGEYGRAETYYRQALAIAPDHRGATEYYGELKVERGDVAGARQLLARLDGICAFGCAEAEELRLWIDRGGGPQAQ